MNALRLLGDAVDLPLLVSHAIMVPIAGLLTGDYPYSGREESIVLRLCPQQAGLNPQSTIAPIAILWGLPDVRPILHCRRSSWA
jgi:hypothetical protein